MSVSDTMFLGCRAIVVEGQSDQLYLSGIKNFLIGNGKIQPKREILFVPTTGAKAIKVVAAILGGRDEDLPVVLCDGDDAGLTLAKHLREEMYKQHPKRIALFSDFLKMQGAEVEDLFPREFMSSLLDRLLKGPGDSPFVAVDGPIVPQVKEYAKRHGLTLDPGWKVELATMVKGRLPTAMTTDAWKPYQEVWQKMFEYVDGGYAQTT